MVGPGWVIVGLSLLVFGLPEIQSREAKTVFVALIVCALVFAFGTGSVRR